jgi:NADPH2 dehydrogenase
VLTELSTDMGMADPLPTFSYLISQLVERHPRLAYIHLVEPRIIGNATRDDDAIGAHESNDALRALWAPRPIIRAGGFSRASAIEAAESGDLIAFGRRYISNVRPAICVSDH